MARKGKYMSQHGKRKIRNNRWQGTKRHKVVRVTGDGYNVIMERIAGKWRFSHLAPTSKAITRLHDDYNNPKSRKRKK